MSKRPLQGEYAPFFEKYINLVPEGNILSILAEQLDEFLELFESLTEEQAVYRYAEGKWSIKEVLGHISDTERVMAYRALRAARGDRTDLPGFNENDFVAGASFDQHPVGYLLDEFMAVRRATISLLQGFADRDWDRRGVVNHHETSAKALIYVIAGHMKHHCNVIRERYLG